MIKPYTAFRLGARFYKTGWEFPRSLFYQLRCVVLLELLSQRRKHASRRTAAIEKKLNANIEQGDRLDDRIFHLRHYLRPNNWCTSDYYIHPYPSETWFYEQLAHKEWRE